MLPAYIKDQIALYDAKNLNLDFDFFSLPTYDPKNHYLELTRSHYFRALIFLRHIIKLISDYYFGVQEHATNIDLYILTPSISSPLGPGSDSEAIPIKFGKYKSNLVDSSQFGLEPLLLNGFDKVYCYQPSMRGENPDKRHLNQFFHCEAEMVGGIDALIPLVEGYIKIIAEAILLMPNTLKRISLNYNKTKLSLEKIVDTESFEQITFENATKVLLRKNKKFFNFTKYGKYITVEGEIELAKLLEYHNPFWIRNYERNCVPFYQKPDPNNPDTVLNGDLIFPPIVKNSFGGEVAGAGQRQDDPIEMIASLQRQKLNQKPYEWYIHLRELPNYQNTSGFGLGVERFITWVLCRDDIKDSILYPRLKNVKTYP